MNNINLNINYLNTKYNLVNYEIDKIIKKYLHDFYNNKFNYFL